MTPRRHLPRAYFADAPTLPAPENLGQLRQPTRAEAAAVRKTAGESGAGNTLSPAVRSTASSHNSPHGTTGASPALAKPAPADDTAAGWQGHSSSRAQQLHAARIISGKS